MTASEVKLPGDKDFWMFIAIDAAMFSVICLVLSHYRAINPEEFLTGHALLSTPIGLFNTFILLTSSYFVARGLTLAREGGMEQAKTSLWWAFSCGAGFVVVKCFEYYEVIQSGGGYSVSTFFSYYFSFTGLHLFHVLIGMLGLWLCIRFYCNEETIESKGTVFIESAGIYWHLVDVIWIFLFLLVYLN